MMSIGSVKSAGIGKQVKRFWPAHFFVLFYLFTLRCSVFWSGDGQKVVGRQAKDDQAGNTRITRTGINCRKTLTCDGR